MGNKLKNKLMREIKFRAWDKAKQRMADVAAIEFIDRVESRTGANVFTDSNKRKERYWIESKDLVLMQFTGLKDKNGKEIYEGDVVKGGSRTMQLVFKQEACQFWLIWKDNEGVNRYEPLTATYGDDTDYFSNDSLEVIGNIYENPELSFGLGF